MAWSRKKIQRKLRRAMLRRNTHTRLEFHGFQRCEFDDGECDFCKAQNAVTWFLSTDYWDDREGNYYCTKCASKLVAQNERQLRAVPRVPGGRCAWALPTVILALLLIAAAIVFYCAEQRDERKATDPQWSPVLCRKLPCQEGMIRVFRYNQVPACFCCAGAE